MDARHWERQGRLVHCTLCPQDCRIAPGKKGFCRARKNVLGSLKSLVYGRPVAMNVDPIEKKPLYHFLPGSSSLSIGTAGCNLACLHCQNFELSCADPEEVRAPVVKPAEIVNLALEKGCSSVSYTYNEPTVFHEYAVDCARLARKKGLKNVIVTNGFISQKAALEFADVMDAANVDLKSFSDSFYRKVAGGRLQPVLDTLAIYRKKVWLEITNLIIEGYNDDMDEIERMCTWIKESLGRDVPLHLSRAFPMHKMQQIRPTPESTLLMARDRAQRHLNHVYIGNAELDGGAARCPKCGAAVAERRFRTKVSGRCKCGHIIPGVFS